MGCCKLHDNQQSSQKNHIDLYEQEIICVQIFASDARVMCVDKKRDVGSTRTQSMATHNG